MDNPIEFKSAKELYNRVLPALYSKVKELRNLGFKYITEKDVWNYLVNSTWKVKRDLQLHEYRKRRKNCGRKAKLLDDAIRNYVMEKMKKLKTRDDNVDEEML